MIPVSELATKTAEWPRRAQSLVIESPEGYSYAAELLTGIKALLKDIEVSCGPVVKAALDAHRAALKQRRELESPLLDAEKTIKQMMAEYFRNQRRKRDELQEKRLEDWIERARAKRVQDVAALEAAGDHELAVATAAAPLPPQDDPPAESLPSQTGIAVRTIYRAEVTDFAVLVRSVHEGRCPLKCLKADQTVLNTFARAMGPTLNWPGVRVIEDVSISARAADAEAEDS
jgi:hypothetical protein